MRHDPNCCPADVDTESYIMGTLNAKDAAAFEAHYLGCVRCLTAVNDTDRYIRAMHDAARRLRNAAARRSRRRGQSRQSRYMMLQSRLRARRRRSRR